MQSNRIGTSVFGKIRTRHRIRIGPFEHFDIGSSDCNTSNDFVCVGVFALDTFFRVHKRRQLHNTSRQRVRINQGGGAEICTLTLFDTMTGPLCFSPASADTDVPTIAFESVTPYFEACGVGNR